MILDLSSDWELKYTDISEDMKFRVGIEPGAVIPVSESIFSSPETAEKRAGEILADSCDKEAAECGDAAATECGSVKTGNCDAEIAGSIEEIPEKSGWFYVDSLPCDIRMPLIRDGVIKEPLLGMNSYESEWVEDKAWWFKKRFYAGEDLLKHEVIEICIDSLDIGAEIFVNGKYAGHHASAFYPFRKNVAGFLREGENAILVRLTTGVERVEQQEAIKYHAATEEKKRPGRG
ncbi:MAG: hypothetical protein PHG48_08560, partial [Eubacteriales bacterium]|nr:hypothetical protein [Eubacteriales bacterium]